MSRLVYLRVGGDGDSDSGGGAARGDATCVRPSPRTKARARAYAYELFSAELSNRIELSKFSLGSTALSLTISKRQLTKNLKCSFELSMFFKSKVLKL